MAGKKTPRKEYLRKRFLEHGTDGLSPRDALELILGYCYSEPKLYEVMDALLSRFGEISNVFNAKCEELSGVAGMTESAAVLIGMMPEIYRSAGVDRDKKSYLNDPKAACEYFLGQYRGVGGEQFKIACLNEDYSVAKCVTVASGSTYEVGVSPARLLESVIGSGCRRCVLSHNHPGGSCVPSDEDIISTERMIDIFASAGIEIIDHIIVGREGAMSMNAPDGKAVPQPKM